MALLSLAILALTLGIGADATSIKGGKVATPPTLLGTEGAPYPGVVPEGLNFTLAVINDSWTYANHPTQDTSNYDCLLASDYENGDGSFNPGPLTVPVPVGNTSYITLDSTGHRIQLYNITNSGPATAGSVIISEPIPNSITPAALSFAPRFITQKATVLLGLFAGSDASGRCLINVTFTSTRTPINPPTGAPAATG